MRINLKSKGMSLIELVITIAIFGLFSLLITALVVTALKSYERGQVLQDIRVKISSLVNRIGEDVSQGYTLFNKTSSYGDPWLPSPVLLPNPYDTTGSAWGEKGEGTSEDRAIMVRSSVNIEDLNLANPVPQLRYIEYLVPQADKKVVQRKILNITETVNGYGGFNRSPNLWLVNNDAYFTSSGNIVRTDELFRLPGAYDSVFFKIQRYTHAAEPDYDNVYDRHLMEITVRMTRYIKGNLRLPITHEETTMARSISRE